MKGLNRYLLIGGAAVAGILIGVLVLAAVRSPHEYAGTVYQNPDAAPGFTLTADDGSQGSLDDYGGQVVLLYFGYTFCPDICPASLAELASALDLLGPGEREEVQVMMVSVDPARDTADVLAAYMDYFDESFVGFTGTDAEIAAVAGDYNVFYQAAEGTAATGYLVDHWSGVWVIDRQGRLVESFSFGTPAADIAADVRAWL